MEQLAPYAVAVALSPMPVAALLLILLSKRAAFNSISFALGWLLGILFLVVVSMQMALTSDSTTGTHMIRNIANGVLGIALIVFAVKQFRNRPKHNQVPHMPKLMAAIENFSPVKSFGIGLLLAILNFKNTPMGIAAGIVLSQHAKTAFEVGVGLLFYVLLSGITVIVPVLGFLLFGKKLQHEFEILKEWLVNNNATIMFVIFLILGVLLLSKAF